MSIPFSFLSTPSGDLDLSFSFTGTMAVYVGQRLRQNLSFFLGEWFLDARQGVPYFQRILAQRFDRGLIESCFRKVALQTNGVASVNRLSVSFNRQTRTLAINQLIVTCTDGSQITQADLGTPLIINLVDPTKALA